jgi:release factor glutamine methyltransferase
MPQDSWTIRRVLNWTTQWFTEQGLESPRVDAELLISDALNLSRMQMYIDNRKPLAPEELAAIRVLVKRRAGHEPVAYITGKRGFWTLDLAVDPRVLVPRPETELIIERALVLLKDVEAPVIADVGTGSGCIALALASEKPQATVIAVDISPEALVVAEANRVALKRTNIALRHGDVLEPVTERALDLIVSNPPYIPTADLAQLMPDVRDYEPQLALDGGADGLDIIRRLIAQAAERLRPDGALLIEIGIGQGRALEALLGQGDQWQAVQVHPDLNGIGRMVEAHRSPSNKPPTG